MVHLLTNPNAALGGLLVEIENRIGPLAKNTGILDRVKFHGTGTLIRELSKAGILKPQDADLVSIVTQICAKASFGAIVRDDEAQQAAELGNHVVRLLDDALARSIVQSGKHLQKSS
jgi:hypothetical protein